MTKQYGLIHIEDYEPLVGAEYESVVYEKASRNHLDHDRVIIHDPQLLPLITHYQKRGPWIWRCHIDLTRPNPELWNYLAPFV